MVSREDVFRFLDLPSGREILIHNAFTGKRLVKYPELRNRTYDFAATKDGGERCCVLPCLSLAQSCRQLRTEYMPICRKAPVTIDWKHVPAYFDTFYPTVHGKVQNVELAPLTMTIIVQVAERISSDIRIDILPIVKMRAATSTFSYQFVYDATNLNGPGFIIGTSPHAKHLLEADNNIVQSLVQHNMDLWLADVHSGKVVKVLVTLIGIEEQPEVDILLLNDQEGATHGEDNIEDKHGDEYGDEYGDGIGDLEIDHKDASYLATVEMTGIFTCMVEGKPFDMYPTVYRVNTWPNV
jgi:hypothetical protein